MIKIGMLTFQEESANLVANLFVEQAAPPDFLTIKETYVRNVQGEDIRAFSIFEFPDEKSEEADEFLTQRAKKFRELDGVSYTLEEWITASEALKLIQGDFELGIMSTRSVF